MAKIIVTLDGNIPSKFAHSFNVMKMANGFHQCGHEVEVVSLLSYPLLKNLCHVKDIHKHYGINKNVKIRLLPVYNDDFFKKSTGARGFTERAVSYFKRRKPDFVYCRSYKSTLACVNNKLPCFMESHTTYYEHPELQKVFKISSSPYFLGFVTINQILAHEYIRRGVPQEKVLVLEDAVDLDQFDTTDEKTYWRERLGLPQNVVILMYSGSLYPEKGIKIILDLKKEINEENIFLYLIGGSSEQITDWEKYITSNGIKKVNFLGFKSNDSIPGYLKAADILLMPYDIKIEYTVMDINTTSPLKLFEYLAAKRPVVSTNIPAINKIVENGKNAMLSEPGDINGLLMSVYKLVEDKKLAESIAEQGFEKVKQHTWKERCKRIIESMGSGIIDG